MRPSGRRRFELREVGAVHREHVVEAVEISALYLPRAQAGQVVATATRGRHGAAIGRLAHVVVGGAGGIDVELQGREIRARRWRATRPRQSASGRYFRGKRTARAASGRACRRSATAADAHPPRLPHTNFVTWRSGFRIEICRRIAEVEIPSISGPALRNRDQHERGHRDRPGELAGHVVVLFLSATGAGRGRWTCHRCGRVAAAPAAAALGSLRAGGMGASQPTSMNTPPAAITARMFASCPSEPKSSSSSLIAALTRNAAPADHCTREPTRRAPDGERRADRGPQQRHQCRPIHPRHVERVQIARRTEPAQQVGLQHQRHADDRRRNDPVPDAHAVAIPAGDEHQRRRRTASRASPPRRRVRCRRSRPPPARRRSPPRRCRSLR